MPVAKNHRLGGPFDDTSPGTNRVIRPFSPQTIPMTSTHPATQNQVENTVILCMEDAAALPVALKPFVFACTTETRATQESPLSSTAPAPPTHRSCHLNNQAHAMAVAYAETGLLSDLPRAIRLADEAVAATPIDHHHRARHIANLAAQWTEFYRRMGAVKILDTATAFWKEALAVAADEDADGGEYRRGLAWCMDSKAGKTLG